MSLATIVAGPYTSTYASASLGVMEEGYELEWTIHKDMVDKTDQYGMAAIEGFYLGMNVFVSGIAKETKASVAALVSPYNTMGVTGSMDLGIIGVADSATAATLVLSAIAGTPAAAAPASLTAAGAIMAENASVKQNFGPWHRKTPYRLRLYPYLSSSVKYFVAS